MEKEVIDLKLKVFYKEDMGYAKLNFPAISISINSIYINDLASKELELSDGDSYLLATDLDGNIYFARTTSMTNAKAYLLRRAGTTHLKSFVGVLPSKFKELNIPKGYYVYDPPIFDGKFDWFQLNKLD